MHFKETHPTQIAIHARCGIITITTTVLYTRSTRILSMARDLIWRDSPGAWHQQLARIVDHRFSTFAELEHFAKDAKKAGVSALMLVEIQNTSSCPGPWYNGLQLCEHINGDYPVADGSLSRWQRLIRELRPMRLMWWVNTACDSQSI